jgi:tellurite methyltransferase
VLREISGYRLDEARDWIAELSCGHAQHVRHKPPFTLRPWTTTAEGRESMLGSKLECPACDRLEIPSGFSPYKRTPEFDEHSLPAGLRARHRTKRGVWAVIHVLWGRLQYVVDVPGGPTFELEAGDRGFVAPEVEHHVTLIGPVRLFVEFWRARSE